MRSRSVLSSLLVTLVVLAGTAGVPAAEARPNRGVEETGTPGEIRVGVQPVRTAKIDALSGTVQRLTTDAVGVARQSPGVFFGLFVAGILFFLPGSAFTIAAGLSYGIGAGLLVSVAASATAAVIHFSVTRYLLRDPIRHRLHRRRALEALDRALTREGWKVVGLTRASALIPGAVQSCLYALTSVPFRSHLLASVGGLIPPTLFYVVVGAAGGDLLAPGGGALARSGARVLFLIPIAVALWYLTREARRAVRDSSGDRGVPSRGLAGSRTPPTGEGGRPHPSAATRGGSGETGGTSRRGTELAPVARESARGTRPALPRPSSEIRSPVVRR